jgi:hypothetical protein
MLRHFNSVQLLKRTPVNDQYQIFRIDIRTESLIQIWIDIKTLKIHNTSTFCIVFSQYFTPAPLSSQLNGPKLEIFGTPACLNGCWESSLSLVIVPRQDPRHTSACALTDSVQLGRSPTNGNTNSSFPEKIFCKI